MNRYRIEVDRIEPNGEIFTLVQYRELKPTRTMRGRNFQLKNLTDKIAIELDYYKVPYNRYTVSMV